LYNNTDASALCVGANSTVTWATSTATPSLIGAFFNPSHYLGSTNVVTGSSVSPASATAGNPNPAQSCYVYQIVVCDSTGSCGVLDPRVVVTGMHVEGKHKKKKQEN
jgi:hypothetical protein